MRVKEAVSLWKLIYAFCLKKYGKLHILMRKDTYKKYQDLRLNNNSMLFFNNNLLLIK